MNPLFSRFLPLVFLACASASAVIPDPLPKAPEPIDDILRLQIFLDTQLFGPGKLDGRPGEFTTKALKRYQRSHGMPESEVETNTLDLSSVPEIYTTYTIRYWATQFEQMTRSPRGWKVRDSDSFTLRPN